jgi:hypothetical protein
MSRTMLLIILGLMLVMGGTCLYFVPSRTRESNIQGTQDSLTVLAWNDASYSNNSTKLEFFYSPSFGSPHQSNMSFPFPFFPMNPSEAEMHGGKPVLLLVAETAERDDREGTVLNATLGTSYNWNGLEIRVSDANPAYVVLSFKPLS